MAGHTPNLGLWYPDGTDPISAGDDGLRELTAVLDKHQVPSASAQLPAQSVAPAVNVLHGPPNDITSGFYGGLEWAESDDGIVVPVDGIYQCSVVLRIQVTAGWIGSAQLYLNGVFCASGDTLTDVNPTMDTSVTAIIKCNAGRTIQPGVYSSFAANVEWAQFDMMLVAAD